MYRFFDLNTAVQARQDMLRAGYTCTPIQTRLLGHGRYECSFEVLNA